MEIITEDESIESGLVNSTDRLREPRRKDGRRCIEGEPPIFKSDYTGVEVWWGSQIRKKTTSVIRSESNAVENATEIFQHAQNENTTGIVCVPKIE